MRNILACSGCGNRFFKYRVPKVFCPTCGGLVKNAVRVSAEERETIERHFLSAQIKIKPQTKEEHEQDVTDLYG